MKKFLLLASFLFFATSGFANAGFFGIGGGLVTYQQNGGASINSYDYGTNIGVTHSLILKGGIIHTFKDGSGNVCGGNMYYRVYKQGDTPGSFTSISLPFNSNTGFSTAATPSSITGAGSGDQRWSNSGQNVDIMALTNSVGTWVLEVYFDASVHTSSSSSGCNATTYFNNGGSNYKLNFTVGYRSNVTTGNSATAASWTPSRTSPASTDNLIVMNGHTITWNENSTINSLRINSGGTFNNGSQTLTIAGGGSITNNGSGSSAFTAGTATVIYAGAGSVLGSQATTFNNVTVNGGLTLTTTPTINGSLQINAGSFLLGTPTYGPSSTLIYNTTSYTTTTNEFPNTGVKNVTITSPSTNEVTLDSDKTITGTFAIGANTVYGAKSISADTITMTYGHLVAETLTTTTAFTCTSLASIMVYGSWNVNGFVRNQSSVGFYGSGNLATNTTFYNLNNISGTRSITSDFGVENTLSVIGGDMRVSGGSGKTLTMSGSNATIDITGGSITGTDASSGNDLTLLVSSGKTTLTGNATVNSDHEKKFYNVTVNNGATLALSRGILCRYGAFTVNGTLQINTNGYVQNVPSSFRAPSYNASTGSLTYNNGGPYTTASEWLTTNSPANVSLIAAGTNITLNGNRTINGVLTLTNGTITTAANTLNVSNSATGAVIRTNGFVIGNLQRAIATGTNTYDYAVGTSSGYTPASITFNGATGGGNVTVASNNGASANYPSGLSATKRVARYWTISNSGVSGFTADASFTYLGADLVGGATQSSVKPFKFDAPSTFSYPSSSTGTLSFTESGLTSFSEFGAGECSVSTSAISGSNSVCANSTAVSYNVTNTTGSSYAWTITGGTQVSGTTTNSITVDWGSAGSGNVSVVETNSAGCVGAAVNRPVTIQALPASAGSNGTLAICSTTTLTEALLYGALTGSPAGGGTWSPALAGAGTYTYTQAAVSPCAVDNTAQVVVTVQAAPASAGANGTLAICSTTTLTEALLFGALTGSPAGGGTWSPALAGAGTYTYTQTATSPCAVNNTAQVVVTVQAAPASAGSNGTLNICSTTTLTTAMLYGALTGSPATGGSWSPAPAGAGTYTYTQAAVSPCAVDNTAQVVVSVVTALTWYQDLDGDGFGSSVSQQSCSDLSPAYRLVGGDCNDGNAAIHPGSEICWNNVDDNCVGGMSEGCTPVVVNMTQSYHNTTLASLSTAVPAVAYTYPGTTNLKYRYSITNVTTNTTAPDIIQTSRYVTIPASIHLYGATYTIKVSAVINDEVVPFAGNTITVTGPTVQLITLSSVSCGATLASLTTTIAANAGLNATGYTFRIRLNDGSTTAEAGPFAYSQSGTRYVSANSFAGFPLQYSKSYKVSVQYTFTDPVTTLPVQSGYGSECTINTPAIPVTTIASPTEGFQVAGLNSGVTATSASYATAYQFRIRLASDNGPTPSYRYTAELPSRFSSLTAFGTPQLAYNTQYVVSVRYSVATPGGPSWSGYGPDRTFKTPFFPVTNLVTSQCGLSGPTSLTQQLNIVPYPGYPHYMVLLEEVNGEDVLNSQEIEVSYSHFTLSQFSIAQEGKSYSVSVSIILNGNQGPYETSCDLFTASNGDGDDEGGTIVKTLLPFKVAAYPNPFANNFMLDVKTTSQSSVNLKVYDMLGRLIENKNVSVSDMETTTIGDQYPSGVYNVIVSQDESVQTVRVVKR